MEILKGIKKYYEDYHGVKIADGLLESAATLSERYITDRYLPDKAIDLIDEAAAHIAVHSPEIGERHELADRREEVRKQQGDLENDINSGAAGDPDAAEEKYRQLADLKAEEMRIDKRLRYLDEKCGSIRMKESDLADVIEIWTGVPASTIAESEYEKLEKLEERLRARIVGQDEAVEAVARAVRRGRTGVSYKRKPVSFIFAGPTGVGKTELVKVLASDLFSSPETFIRLDMSEYMDKFSVSRIIGSPPGYVGYDDAGQLTEKIRRRPYSVVLFDEIEKAHPDVMNILLQILDDGRITDAQGRTVNFENTIIIMTTNAGSGNKTGSVGFGGTLSDMSRERALKALNEFLRPEFINRVDEVVCFNQLTEENFRGIAALMLTELREVMAEKNHSLSWDESLLDYLVKKGYSVTYGARNLRRLIQKEIEDAIAAQLIAKRGQGVDTICLSAENDKVAIDLGEDAAAFETPRL